MGEVGGWQQVDQVAANLNFPMLLPLMLTLSNDNDNDKDKHNDKDNDNDNDNFPMLLPLRSHSLMTTMTRMREMI